MLVGVLFAFTLTTIKQDVAQIGNPGTSYKAPDLCGFAKVNHLQEGSYLSVRSGPGSQFSKIDSLEAGTSVYVCDEHREWLRIFYGGKDTPCGSESPGGLDARKAATCKSGWVNRKWIDVLSG